MACHRGPVAARACGIPVGTVRSRLSQGRAKLAEALRATSAVAHEDAGLLAARGRQNALDTLAAAERGEFHRVLADRWSPRVVFLGGPEPVASRDLVVWEMDLLNPPDDPEHCPPAVTGLMSLGQGRVARLRLYHSPMTTATANASN
ncbi:hypothetical protein [Amycolatopsis saalfeldensis]|uniref:RNA polymerase sigma-70 factor, ECF subfamily n=1 Tax=Amycolatopsis saalfeldensis TaxID=394193 RepID=A0A1H8YKF0_9PSEU|nr:hypothetical protein [Amycolatopsis saalfeldensis]SEP52636.1 RNA polymerase sigma-70 factor, ECF subfamily [Amycolatopsis saalfeldensis]